VTLCHQCGFAWGSAGVCESQQQGAVRSPLGNQIQDGHGDICNVKIMNEGVEGAHKIDTTSLFA